MASKPNGPLFHYLVLVESETSHDNTRMHTELAQATAYAKELAAQGRRAIVYQATNVFEAVTKIEATWSSSNNLAG